MGDPSSVISVVPHSAEPDTVGALESLLVRARAGDVIGIAWIALEPAEGYHVDIAGHVREIPIFVRGLLPVLAAELDKISGSK